MNIFLTTLLISIAVQIGFFVFAAAKKTDKVTDLSYGLTFIILAMWVWVSEGGLYNYKIVLFGMVFIWGLRLAGYLFVRILQTGRDKRFDGIRENFLKFAKFWSLQAVAVWVISLPVVYVLAFDDMRKIGLVMKVGFGIWAMGLFIEKVADWQKFLFKSEAKNKGKWIESGLWKYSRHPNYFGEMLVWWGVFVYTIPFQMGVSWLTMAGPVFITYLLMYGTGVPTLERKYDRRHKNNKKYQEYKRRTNLIIPGRIRK